MNRNYIHPKKIEKKAYDLLARYQKRFGDLEAPPAPLDRIAESYLNVGLEFDDLSKRLSEPAALGCYDPQRRLICIDESLDPTVYPSQEGRYHFTFAHEIGHHVLHGGVGDGESNLFELSNGSVVMCRSGSSDPREVQANYFAGYLLMPALWVREAWRRLYGATRPYLATREIADLRQQWQLGEEQMPTVERAKQMAAEFKVSGQAMQIRLTQLGLLITEPQPEGLF